MRIRIFQIAVAATVCTPGAAYADSGWSGPYGGVYATVGMQRDDKSDTWCWMACNPPQPEKVVVAVGVNAGANASVAENLMLGIEGDFGTGGSTTFYEPFGYDGSVADSKWQGKVRKQGSVRIRAGLVTGRTLVFLTGGVAAADYRAEASSAYKSYTPAAPGMRWGSRVSGWTAGYVIGAGLEQRFNRISGKLEVLRTVYAPIGGCLMGMEGPNAGICWNGLPSNVGFSFRPQTTMARVGINMHF